MKSISGKWPIICSIIAGITILGICYMIFIIAPKRKHEAEQEHLAVLVKQEQIRKERIQQLIDEASRDLKRLERKNEELNKKDKQERAQAAGQREREQQESIKRSNEERQKEQQDKLAEKQRLKQIQQNELAKWKELKIGMTKTRVEKILGVPTSRQTYEYNKSEDWSYPLLKDFYSTGRIEFKDGKLSSWNAPEFTER